MHLLNCTHSSIFRAMFQGQSADFGGPDQMGLFGRFSPQSLLLNLFPELKKYEVWEVTSDLVQMGLVQSRDEKEYRFVWTGNLKQSKLQGWATTKGRFLVNFLRTDDFGADSNNAEKPSGGV